eukprot:6192688-Pleurochrysis_carterae.AAC.2
MPRCTSADSPALDSVPSVLMWRWRGSGLSPNNLPRAVVLVDGQMAGRTHARSAFELGRMWASAFACFLLQSTWEELW